ncbi:MAG: DUF4276 family protein [Blastocatellia bacterium]
MKFILFIEGHAEKTVLPDFLGRWLNPKLNRRVGFTPVRFDGCGDYLSGFAKKAVIRLNGPSRDEIIAVVGLLDLYGLPGNFYPSHLTDAENRYEWAKQELQNRVGNEKFLQFFAVHELEAWLLSNPELFPREVKNAFPGSAANPESVNFNQPPGKLLDKLFREKLKRNYKKTVDGHDLFANLDPEVAYQKCPHLREMLDEMLKLARDAETDHADTQHSTRRTSSSRSAARRPKDRPRPGR